MRGLQLFVVAASLGACASLPPDIPESGLRLAPEQVGQPPAAFSGFPAVSLDGSRLVAVEVADGVGPNLTVREYETRVGDVLREWVILGPGERLAADSPELKRRLNETMLDLSTQMWLPMLAVRQAAENRFAGEGLDIRFDGQKLSVVRGERPVYAARPPWAAQSAAFCTAPSGSCACKGRPVVRQAWTSIDRGELYLRVDYEGEGCTPSPSVAHIRRIPTAVEQAAYQ